MSNTVSANSWGFPFWNSHQCCFGTSFDDGFAQGCPEPRSASQADVETRNSWLGCWARGRRRRPSSRTGSPANRRVNCPGNRDLGNGTSPSRGSPGRLAQAQSAHTGSAITRSPSSYASGPVCSTAPATKRSPNWSRVEPHITEYLGIPVFEQLPVMFWNNRQRRFRTEPSGAAVSATGRCRGSGLVARAGNKPGRIETTVCC